MTRHEVELRYELVEWLTKSIFIPMIKFDTVEPQTIKKLAQEMLAKEPTTKFRKITEKYGINDCNEQNQLWTAILTDLSDD